MRAFPAVITICCALSACGGSQSRSDSTTPTASGAPAGPTTAAAIPLEQMTLAHAAAKSTVAVDVRYQISGTPARDQPMQLQLAFVPRVAGENLRVEFAPSDTVSVDSASTMLVQQKASAAEPYRRLVTVTPRTDGEGQVRLIVSMDVERTRAFGIFSVPVGGTQQP